ncbi:YjeF N-terminal domain-containing protein [Mucor mucedo]|uniref:YjeF N-terminal domain-containing protein n=1 Tax=Mucor mucedo TaxID=29922 RepID=UPI00221F915A|nr:YjeF N-terminal domain-containing protein [Mucor mucedo]KAI7873142.1 YjeF N-terminal domain-containing protein [Mucor mucedo]
MAEAFLGYKVSVLLHSGIKLEGVVSHIEPSTQQMTLKDVTLFLFGQAPFSTPLYGVVGKDIKDLQIISTPSSTTQQQQPPPIQQQQQAYTPLDNHVLEQDPPPPLVIQAKVARNSTSYGPSDGWAGEDVNIFREEEFDFQKNLDMFDKAKVFAEIRESDETAPEELLVTLNRLPQKVNLLPTENVLSVERTPYNETTSDDLGDETQMAHVLHECTKASPAFDELAMENAGRGTSFLLLQLLSQMDVVSPSIVILVGNNKNGCSGLIAARHLINHGCLVTVCISTEQPLTAAMKRHESMTKKFGVIIVYDILELGEADFIVDAILGAEDNLAESPDCDIICKTVDWVNEQTDKPVLSVDFPTGVDASTGTALYAEQHVIRPKWTLCLGAPKSGCKSLRVTGELFLVDIGIPRLCWKRVGIKGNTIPWGADFLVPLEYHS